MTADYIEKKHLDDEQTSMSFLRQMVKEFVTERNWEPFHNPKDLSIAISIEVAELMEHFLFKPGVKYPQDKQAFMEEMADIFIYLISLANTLEIDSFSQIVARKMRKNQEKYPIEKYSGKNYSKQ